MKRIRVVYWAHTNPSQPSRLFKKKGEALDWGRRAYAGFFIVEPIAMTKLSERVDYLRSVLGYDVTTA